MRQVSNKRNADGESHVHVPPSICLLPVDIQLFISPSFLCYCAGDQKRLANDQHQHHEGRVEGVLVCLDCRVPVLVQRWGGERALFVRSKSATGIHEDITVMSWRYPKRLLVSENAVIVGVCVPTQHNQCADYCSALVWWTGSLNTGQAGWGVTRTLVGGRTMRSLWLQVTTLGQ